MSYPKQYFFKIIRRQKPSPTQTRTHTHTHIQTTAHKEGYTFAYPFGWLQRNLISYNSTSLDIKQYSNENILYRHKPKVQIQMCEEK